MVKLIIERRYRRNAWSIELDPADCAIFESTLSWNKASVMNYMPSLGGFIRAVHPTKALILDIYRISSDDLAEISDFRDLVK